MIITNYYETEKLLCVNSRNREPIRWEISSKNPSRGDAPSPIDIFNQDISMNQEGENED